MLWLSLCILVAPISPLLPQVFAAGVPSVQELVQRAEDEAVPGSPDAQEATSTKDFIDKWILNGGSIGGAAGATLGQWLGTVLLPGPVGWVVGSIIGGFVGGIVGTLIDNSIHKGYNYASFERPPLEQGGLVLEGVGAWEQRFYQVDQWLINGGSIGSFIGHFGVNLIGAAIPGPLGSFLSSYLGIFLFDVVFGTVGDNLDALIDGGKIGREIDKAQAGESGAEITSDEDAAKPPLVGRAYKKLLEAIGQDRGKDSERESVEDAYQQYLEGSDPLAPASP